MAYLVIAYPELTANDFDEIQSFRQSNDLLYYTIVEPHFTVVFPVTAISEEAFVTEIKDKANGIQKIHFVIRCATINKDDFKAFYHTFLVPDEGYSQIVKLHDALYSDKLKDNLRLDIDFIPHIGIGNATDPLVCKKMVDHWNAKEFAIKGTIAKLTIVNYENDSLTKIEEIELP